MEKLGGSKRRGLSPSKGATGRENSKEQDKKVGQMSSVHQQVVVDMCPPHSFDFKGFEIAHLVPTSFVEGALCAYLLDPGGILTRSCFDCHLFVDWVDTAVTMLCNNAYSKYLPPRLMLL